MHNEHQWDDFTYKYYDFNVTPNPVNHKDHLERWDGSYRHRTY